MNSMKRTVSPLSLPNSAKSTISSSLIPLIMTALILTGCRPASSAASIPSRTRSSSSRRVNSRNRSGRSESRLMLMRFNPASARGFACMRNVAPFVVSAVSTPKRAKRSTSSGRCARTSGSPPVRRMPSNPKYLMQIRANRSISSKERISSLGSHCIPSAGMQYWHLKLQRSVTEIRRSRTVRPKGSTNGSPTISSPMV